MVPDYLGCRDDRVHYLGIPGGTSPGKPADIAQRKLSHRPDIDDRHWHYSLRHDGGTAAVFADPDGLSGTAKWLCHEPSRYRGILYHISCGPTRRAHSAALDAVLWICDVK